LPDIPADALRIGGIDLVDPQAAVRALETVNREFGKVDALLNIAGAFVWRRSAMQPQDRMYDLNVKTALNASKAALPYLIASGAGHRQHRRGRRVEGRRRNGRIRGREGRRRAAHRGAGRGTARSRRHGERAAAEHHRHAAEPRRHAGCGLLALGAAQNSSRRRSALLSDDAQAITGASIPVSGRVA
jgi:hypothetical protein